MVWTRPGLTVLLVFAIAACAPGSDGRSEAESTEGTRTGDRRSESAAESSASSPMGGLRASEEGVEPESDAPDVPEAPESAPRALEPASVEEPRASQRRVDSEPAGSVEGTASLPSVSGGSSTLEPSPAADPPALGDPAALDDPGPDPLYVPAGTVIPVAVGLTLSTRTHEAGDAFFATLLDEVLAADGMVLLPAGVRVEGTISDSRRSTDADEAPVLILDFDAIVIEGAKTPFEAVVTDSGTESSSAATGTRSAVTVLTGAAAGAVVGRLLGGDSRGAIQGAAVGAIGGAGIAIVTRDGHAVIREGTRMTLRLEAPVPLTFDPR